VGSTKQKPRSIKSSSEDASETLGNAQAITALTRGYTRAFVSLYADSLTLKKVNWKE
jgi:hypothetical protein